MVSFDESVAVVTGAGSGIGRTTAIEFASRGVNVVVADIDTDGADGTVDEIRDSGGSAVSISTDVTEYDETKAMVEFAVETYGRLDFAFNNAGIGGAETAVFEYPAESWQRVIDVNLVGVFNCLRAELERMVDQASGGVIVNNSSILGTVGFEGASGYVAAKHGVLGLTKTAALETATDNVRVVAVCPGFIDTPLLEEAGITSNEDVRSAIEQKHPMNRLGTSQEIADAVLWLCSDEASFVTGTALEVEGGYLSQ